MRPALKPILLRRPSLWTPAQLRNDLALWLDAADASTITLNGSNVSQWSDKSGNGRHVTQATAANQPAYTLSGINSRPALIFNGLSTTLRNSAVGLPTGAAARSMLVVYKPTVTFGVNTICGHGGPPPTTSAWFYLQFRIGGDPYFAGYSNDIFSSSFPLANTNPKIAEIVYDGTIGSLYSTGSLVQSAARALNTTGNTFVAGNNTSDSEPMSEPMNGMISEIIFMSSAASSLTRQQLEGYLAHKWGLAANLPANHPYRYNAPRA